MQAAEQRGRAVLEQDAAVAHVAARAALLHFGGGIAVERERQAQLRGLFAQPRQDRGVAPVAQDQVGIVPREQMLERDGGGFARFVEFELASVHLDFERGPLFERGAMPGIDALQAAQAHAQDFERRRLVVDRPFGVAAFEREDAAFAVGFDFDARQRKHAALPAVQRREHQVAVVKPQRGIELAHPARPRSIFVRMRDLDLQHGTRALLPQIHALGRAAGKRVRLPRGFPRRRRRTASGPDT